jgi:hypothetical protein
MSVSINSSSSPMEKRRPSGGIQVWMLDVIAQDEIMMDYPQRGDFGLPKEHLVEVGFAGGFAVDLRPTVKAAGRGHIFYSFCGSGC